MKKNKAKPLVITLVSAILVISAVVSCISLWPASIDYGTSEVYSKQDMDSAIEMISDTFSKWEGCKLYSINYTNDDFCKNELDYCNTLADEGVTYDQCIVFRMQFRSPIFGGGAWNANRRYEWSWYLARTEGGEWDILTWGAP